MSDIILVVFLPLISAIIAGCFAKRENSKILGYAISTLMIFTALLSVKIYYQNLYLQETIYIELLNWINVADFKANWGLQIDSLSLTMILVVNVVSAIVHIYSLGYMADDKNLNRFLAYLSLFTFFMLVLVTAANLLQLFVGWEGVGLCSYLLIGFWYKKDSANKAAFKAFIANRVGDFAFIIGLIGIYLLFDSIYFADILNNVAAHQEQEIKIFGTSYNYISFICLMLFIGCMGKSAQLGLHVWLPDAMEGPTPVSALIHAATMVTAGVFLLIRCSAMFEYAPAVLEFITLIGALTCIFAATVAITQNDIKKVIAYSTCSQLGYMFFACGVSAYPAAMFHLVTHAFYKALLFLGAGSVIVAAHHKQDMREMGGLWKATPVTYLLFWIGSLAIAGIPPFAGYYSKDVILEAAFMSHTKYGVLAYSLGTIAAFLTALYSWRLIFMVFHGEKKITDVHRAPRIMIYPLFILALGAIVSGYVGYKIFHVVEVGGRYFSDTITILPEHQALANIHHTPILIKYLPLLTSLLGIFCAALFYFFKPHLAKSAVNGAHQLYVFLYNKWYFDELYNAYIVKNYRRLAKFFAVAIDKNLVDNLGPNGAAFVTRKFSRLISSVQTGYIYHYAFSFVLGLVLLLGWLIFRSI